MNKDEQTHSLLVRIRDAIKSFVDSDISFTMAKDVFRELEREYKELEMSAVREGGGSYLKGIIYHHTVNNFAKLTVLFELKDGLWSPLIYSGSEDLLPIARQILDAGKILLKNDAVASQSIQGDDRLDYRFLARYLHPVEKKHVLAAITSSSYFSEEDFLFLCDVARSFHTRSLRNRKDVSLDLFSTMNSEIKSIITAYLESEIKAEAHLYSFEPFTDIFSHMGIRIISDVSEEIYQTLRRSYSLDAMIYILSLSKYLVIFPKAEPVQPSSAGKLKINFIFDGIILKFSKNDTSLSSLYDIHQLWLDISESLSL